MGKTRLGPESFLSISKLLTSSANPCVLCGEKVFDSQAFTAEDAEERRGKPEVRKTGIACLP